MAEGDAQNTEPLDQYVLVGEITSPHGIQGEVKLKPYLDKPELLTKLSAVLFRYADGRQERRRITSLRRQQKNPILTVAGILDRDGADTIRGAEIFVRRDQMPPSEPGTYYEFELMGLSVVTESGKDLGAIERVHFIPAANDVYETPVAMIPAVESVVVSVDIAARRMVVRDIPGLRKDE